MPQDIIIRPLILFIIKCLSIYQNTEKEEKELLRACEDGDIETVKRLSSVITVRKVRWYWHEESPLHIAARYVNLLFHTINENIPLCLTYYNVTLCL